MGCGYVIILFIVINVYHKIDGELNVIPRDTEVKINDSIYMNCSTSLRADHIQWLHGNNYVYTGIAFLEPYNDGRFTVEINTSTGASNLVIRSVQPSDAGKYKCLEDEGFGERKSAQLVVLNDAPVCTSNMNSAGVVGPNSCGIEPDEIQLSCSVTHHGNIPPILQWKTNGDNQSIIEGLFNVTSSNNEVTYTLTMRSTIGLNSSSFVCETTRTSNKHYSCFSNTINILYVFSSEVTVNMTINDEVNCSANTSQSCIYKWKWFSDGDITTESDNQILKPQKVGWHRCEATCPFGNRSCTVEAMYAKVYPTEVQSMHAKVHSDFITEVYSDAATSSKKLLILLSVLLVVPVVLVIGIVIYTWRQRIKKQKQREERTRQRLLDIEKTQHDAEEQERQRQRLFDELPEKYKSDLVLVETIKTKPARDAKKSIFGLTILDNELFVVSERSSEVEVYDSVKFSFSRPLNLMELIDPWDIGSCKRNKCLYIFDFKGHAKLNEILRVDPNGKLIKNWSTEYDWGWGLSVTDETNVILTVSDKNKLNEYSPDGQLIREIHLSSDAGICNPMHAVKLTNGNFLVSHGDNLDDLQKVCTVCADGKPIKSLDGKPESTIGQMNEPFHLSVDGDGFVMVADRQNGRVLLLDSDLKFKREILSKEKDGLRRPWRIILDSTNGRLLVADNERDHDGRISIFSFT